MFETHTGIDVHGDHGLVTWPTVRKAGITFAFIKATEGLTFKDARFAAYLQEATGAGILVGPYHYARPDVRPSLEGARSEAAEFVKTIRYAGWNPRIHARPVLDLEEGSGNLAPWAEAFCSTVEKLTGVTPILYSYSSFISSFLSRQSGELSRYPLWIANYGRNTGVRHSIPAAAGPWKSWTIHQYSSNGSVPGSVGRTDLNFTPDLAPLRALAAPGKPGRKPLPGPRRKPKWFWPAVKEFINRRNRKGM